MKKRCIIIGAAPCRKLAGLSAIRAGDFILCADGGLQVALDNGLTPDLAIGDFDSLQNTALLEKIPHRVLPVEKDDTDAVAALRVAAELHFSDVVLLNVTGGRIDHTFANFSALFFAKSIGINAMMISDETEIHVSVNETVNLTQKIGYRLSVFAFGGTATVSISGVHYPLSEYTLTPFFPLGISNEIEQNDARLVVHDGAVLWMTERM